MSLDQLAEMLQALADATSAAGLHLRGWDDGGVYIEGDGQNRTRIRYDPHTGRVAVESRAR